MHKPNSIRHLALSNSGFTLLELIVVLAGLGILSSLAIPNYLRYLDYAKVDEAKALLNSVAADCLRGMRFKSDRRNQVVSESIISMKRLRNTGYVFKDGTDRVTDEEFLPKCNSVQITALSEDDRLGSFPDLGFFINESAFLTKIAGNDGSETELPAYSWAGSNTTDGKQLKDWLELNEAIEREKGICKVNRENFVKNTGNGWTKMWDPVKTSKCTNKPPKFEDPETCTPAGCTKDVWYIDRSICGYTEAEFQQCQRDKTSAACQKEKDKKADEKATTQTLEGDLLPNCDKPVWFVEGVDAGSADSWRNRMCIRSKNDLKQTYTDNSEPIEYCGPSPVYICGGQEFLGPDAQAFYASCRSNNKNSICRGLLEEDALKRRGAGPWTSPIPTDMAAPIGNDCGIEYWYCQNSGKIYKGATAKENYENDEACSSCEKENPFLCDLGFGEIYCQCKEQ